MLEQIFNSPSMHYLGRGLEAASLRQSVIANNIANVTLLNLRRARSSLRICLLRSLWVPARKRRGS